MVFDPASSFESDGKRAEKEERKEKRKIRK
jgi:hypothetical protein